MNKNTKIMFVIALIVVVVFMVVYFTQRSKEGYADLYYNADLNNSILQTPTFHTNLDPRNPNMRSDPYTMGGYIKGTSPPSDMLASDNNDANSFGLSSDVTIAKSTNSKEGFSLSLPSVGGDQTTNTSYRSGITTAGANIVPSSSNYTTYAGSNTPLQYTNTATGDYKSFNSDFSSLVDGGSLQAKKMQAQRKYTNSLENKSPNTLSYTVPKDLLPTPDMRQTTMRDPSDPSNFMYDRTLFAPLKKRNHNQADRIRGDLNITPIKSGWFDAPSIPSVDLVKGYFGTFNDIQQTEDLQDTAFQRASDVGTETMTQSEKTNNIISSLNAQMMTPHLAYGKPKPILQSNKPMTEASYTTDNPWWNPVTQTSNRDYEL